MQRIRDVSFLAAALLALPAAAASAQALPGGVSNFNDGTAQGWFTSGGPVQGTPIPATVVLGGGPGGASDPYMLLTATGGSGPGSRLTVSNASQWAGNYLAASIVGLSMSVNNFGTTDLFLRLAFETLGAMGPTNIAFSTNPIFVPGGSGWTQIFFPTTPAALTAALGTVDAALANTTLIRLYHSQAPNVPNPFMPIDPVVAQLGVDNVTSVVPEPASLLLLGTGGLIVGAFRRRRRRSET